MRHGQVSIDHQLRLTAAEFGDWIASYNSAGLAPESAPPQTAIQLAQQCAVRICSNLPRSLESAKRLEIRQIDLADPLFREMEMPHALWRFPKLPVSVWLVVFRVAWMLGYARDVESFTQAKARAEVCAQRLISLASKHGSVLFVGHGSLNWFIARNLKRQAWQTAASSSSRHWQQRVFQMPSTESCSKRSSCNHLSVGK